MSSNDGFAKDLEIARWEQHYKDRITELDKRNGATSGELERLQDTYRTVSADHDLLKLRIAELEKRLAIEGDQPFPKGYDAIDLLNDRLDAFKAENEKLRGLITGGIICVKAEVERYCRENNNTLAAMLRKKLDAEQAKEQDDE